jgi:hypothetical protein
MAGGIVGTLVLTTVLRAASEFKLTRIDLPFLLGSAFVADRGAAKALGYVLHFVAGMLFAVGYFVVFWTLDMSGAVFGALLGALHALFAATALVNILLPIVHPRMGDASSGSHTISLLEPPGFLMRNYGVGTPLVMLVAHIAYGAIIGAFVSAAG